MAAIPLLRSQTSLLNSSKFKLLRPSLNSFIIYNQNPNFSRHFRPIHSITRKSFKGVGSNWEEGSNNQHNQHHQNPNYSRHSLLWEGNESLGHNTTQWQGTYVGSNGEEGSKNKFSVSENKTSENTMKLSGLPEQMVEHNAPVHPITPKSFPESPLIDVNGVCEEPTSEPSPRGWSMFSSPQSTPTNSIKGVGSSGEEGPRIQVNLSSVSENEIYENKLSLSENETSKNTKNWVRIGRQGISESRNTFGTLNSFSASENETSEDKFSVSENATSINRMKPSSLPEHNAPVHPITPKSFPESPFINVNGASEEPISEPSHRGWSMFSSPQTTPTNSIKGVGSSGEEGSRIQLNLSPDVSESVVSMDFVAGGKKGKSKIHWVCAYCGHSTGQWWGTCHSCHKVGTMKQCSVSENETSENMFRVSENEAYETESWVSENKTSDSRMKSSSLPEQMVGHNAPVHPITPKSFPESPLIVVNGASEEPISESSASGWSTFSSPQGNQTNSIKSVGSSGKEGKRIRVNLSPDVAKSVILRDFVAGGKKGKSKIHWVCVDCGHSTTQWWGTCHSCHKVGTMKQFSVSENETSENMMKSSWLPEQMVGQNRPVRLVDVNRGINHMEWRIRLSGLLGLEVNRVLGGGVVPGSLILFGGDPGVGKSTLALQLAALVAVSGDVGGAAPVLYISGEESVEQIGNRADRLSIDTEELFLYSSTDIEDIVEKVRVLSPRVVVVDSIQTMYLKGVAGSPGGMMQVKECTSALLRFAKKTNIPVLLIGHVNKNGEIAGPRVLEHIVDVVLYMEGEKHSSHRLLRSVKNRFGSTDELGVFAMSVSGLDAVSNPSEMFLSEEYSDSQYLPGLAISVIIDGSRSFLVEVQALCVSGPGSTRHINGVQLSRADMILSVLKKQAGLKLEEHSIFLNIISGVTLSETSGDLAVAAAICSSFLEFPLHNRMAFIGEIGLGGELRMVPRIEKRVTTLAKLGYEKCVVPASAGKALEAINPEIEIVACKNLNEVLDKVFRDSD